MSNRQERRTAEKLEKKRRSWYESLLPYQRQFIEETVAAARNFRYETVVNMLDVAQSGALAQLTDLSFKEIYAINMQTGEYLTELLEVDKKLGTERNLKMKVYDEKVLKEMEALLKEGNTKGQVAKTIRTAYKEHGYTTADVNVLLKQAIETVALKNRLGEGDVETENAVEYIFSEDAPVETKASKFKVTYKELEVQGDFGNYSVSGDKIDGFTLPEHEEKCNSIRDNILEQIKNLTNTLDLHENKLAEMQEISKEFMK